ncbi:hypothetical protein BH09BAC2_BH09BAC2_00850 [soil metagenome]
MNPIFRKELNEFFSSLTGYITIILFLLVNGIFLFVLKDSNLFDYGYATLDRFFELAPWILLFLVPALSMRSLSEEFKTGTFELLQTRPIAKLQIVLGKYLALLLIIFFVLLPTLIYVFTIKSLATTGDIDTGGISGSYIGLLFLAAVFAAISLFCSGLTQNSVVAFLLSAFACLVLYFGFSALSNLPQLNSGADYYIQQLGIDFHYRSISRGVVDSRDLIYFLSVICLFILMTVKGLQQKYSFDSKNLLQRFWWIAALLILLVLNYMTSVFHTRIDLTNEKRFTISAPVKKIIKNIDEPITIDVFLKGEMPAAFKGIADYTSDLLDEFKEINGSRIKVNFIVPDENIPGTDKTYADTLQAYDITPINLKMQLKSGEQSQYIYPAALVYYKDRVAPVILYEGNRANLSYTQYYKDITSAEALMEYKFADAIKRLTDSVKPLIAYSSGNGEPMGANTYDLVENILKKNYSLYTFNLNKEPVIPDTFKLLMIVKPSIPFTESEKIKIDQFVMHGGKVLWMPDKLNAEMDSLRLKNQVVAFDRGLNLEDILFRYGVRINSDLLMDLQSDYLPFNVNGKDQYEFMHWNYFPLFESNSKHFINKNLGLVAGRFVNSIDTVKAANIHKTILLNSSPNARTISAPAIISGAENRNAPEDENFKTKNIPVAVLLEGNFTSLYANRMTAASIDTLKKYGVIFQPASPQTKMIVVADGDIALNSLYQNQPTPMGINPFTAGTQYQYQFANRDFVQNCLEYLSDESGLAEVKGKDYTLRLLDPKKISEERNFWQMINIIVPVLLISLFGLIYQWLRKRKYQRV